jgi:hypothetical protein
MANPQQLDIVKPNEIEDTITRLMTKGLLGGAPTPVDAIGVDPGMFEHAASGTASTVDGLSSHAMSHGATVISGPPEGGSLLERPVGSFLADQATHQSLELEQYAGDHGPTYLAKRVAGAGEMHMAGMDVNLIDFVPGGDFVQMAAGEKFDPTTMMMALAKGRMEAEVIHGHLLHRETDHEREERRIDMASSPSMGEDTPYGEAGSGHAGSETTPWGTRSRDGAGMDGQGKGEEATMDGEEGKGRVDEAGRPVIDSDTAARDLAILGGEHARNLDNAVSQWDEQDVHTEMTLHGRRVEIDTHFDAHNPDNAKEREKAEDHVKEIPVDGNRETVTEGNRMAFRSQVHAHLEAASRDEGISR